MKVAAKVLAKLGRKIKGETVCKSCEEEPHLPNPASRYLP